MIIYENIICKKTGRVIGRGNSLEVSVDEAAELIKAGSHRAESPSELTMKPSEEAPQEDVTEKKEDGNYND